MVVNAEQPENASVAMLLVLAGIETPESPVQPLNAPLPIVVTPAGTAMDARLLQFSNALLPILLMEDAMDTLVNAEQPLNVLFGMELIEAWSVAHVILEHPENTPVPMVDTLPGTDTHVIYEKLGVRFDNFL